MATRETHDAEKAVAMARSRFIYGLDKVPDDKLTWSPGGSAKNALELAGRFAGLMHAVAYLLENRTFPERPAAPPAPPASRDEAKNAVHAAASAVQGKLAGLADADLEGTAPAPWGAMIPLRQWLGLVGYASGYYQGQLNYLQLAYGDEDPNIPPGWGSDEG